MARSTSNAPAISLALQGGGAHGAFTWGVLDRLLEAAEEGSFRIAALSGTSAGAMNAAVCAAGLAEEPKEARAALERFWTRANQIAFQLGNPYLFVPHNATGRGWNFDDHPLSLALNIAQQFWSPYYNFEDLSPFRRPSLRDVVEEVVGDFALLNAPKGGVPKVFVAATDVARGCRKVFGPGELSVEALLASACLPNMERAVKIGDDHFWDGGFTANPALKPLIAEADDLVVVQLNPALREGRPPRTPAEITDRINEISFNASLVLEINAIEVVNKAVRTCPAGSTPWKLVNIHPISDDSYMADLGLVSKFNLQMDFLGDLRTAGRKAGDRFIADCLPKIGKRSSVDVKREIVDPFLEHC